MGRRVSYAALAADEPTDPTPATWSTAARRTVPIADLVGNPLNPRKPGDDDALEELAETIRAHGVLQAAVVCSVTAYLENFPDQRGRVEHARWVVLIGNRRLAAALLAGQTELEVIENDELAASMYEAILIENGQRRDLPPVLEAETMARVLEQTGISQRELARRIGRSHVFIGQRLSLLRLIPELRQAFERGQLTIERARELGELDPSLQEDIAAGGPPYREHPPRPLPGQPRTTPAAPFEQLASRLAGTLAAPVTVKRTGERKGRIVVEFTSLDELQRLATQIGGPLVTPLTAAEGGVR
jgi:ParB family chromosome partitioning protein